MTDLLSELEALTDKFRHDPYVSGAEQVEIAHRIDAIKAEIAAAVRDARGERSESWEVWQDDMPVAGSDSIADAKHYLMMYGQDGPVKLVRKVEYRETVTPEQITAMRAGEGEG